MGLPLLAVGERASAPYTFSRLLISIYSVEELCYLFKTNPFILDANIVDKRLILWLEKECGLGELAEDLLKVYKKNKGAEEFVKVILEYTGYLNQDEIDRVCGVFRGNVGLTDYEMELNRADFLLGSGKYQRARHEYDRILMGLPEGERVISSRVYHNRGVSLSRLFLFEQAAVDFLKAFEFGGRPESGRAYLLCIRLSMDEMDYIRFIAEVPAFHDFSLEVEHIYNQVMNRYNESDGKMQIDDLILDKAMGKGNSYNTGIDRLISEAKKNYRSFVET